jgi:hypothetical protein
VAGAPGRIFTTGAGGRDRVGSRSRSHAGLLRRSRRHPELCEPGFELIGALCRLERLLAQRGDLPRVREVEQHEDRQPDDRREADV